MTDYNPILYWRKEGWEREKGWKWESGEGTKEEKEDGKGERKGEHLIKQQTFINSEQLLFHKKTVYNKVVLQKAQNWSYICSKTVTIVLIMLDCVIYTQYLLRDTHKQMCSNATLPFNRLKQYYYYICPVMTIHAHLLSHLLFLISFSSIKGIWNQ